MTSLPETLTAALADRYRLARELGAGGMATVYEADDIRHDRRVAIKVLNDQIAAALGAARFLREIGIAARLQHPHIVPVFESGESNGHLYYVMPLIEGESLRNCLERECRLDVSRAITLAREIADALDYAHGQGVVHRDIKPENILLSRGHALLADFGIARSTTIGDAPHLTEAGTSLGTPAYMSPEQAAGEHDVGPASDIFSLACVLFEIIAGELPFRGDTPQAILVRRFTDVAPRLRDRRPHAPTTLDAAVARALSRDPGHRFPSAAAFSAAIAPHGPRALDLAGDRSIVVVPFDNLSPDPDDSYLADGLSEEVIADLSKVDSLRVIARNSAVAARQRTRDLKEIARLLNVRYLLEGSVRRAGNALRITAQLIDGTTDSHLWAQKYQGSMDDVFGMQEEIARAIVSELKAKLTPDEDHRLGARAITSLPILEACLRARRLADETTRESLDAARRIITDAIRRFGESDVLLVAAGGIDSAAATVGLDPDGTAPARVAAAASRALELNPSSSRAMALKAIHHGRSGEMLEACRWARAATRTEFSAEAAFGFVAICAGVGLDLEVVPWSRRAIAADPFNTLGTFWASCGAAMSGEAAQAVEWAQLCFASNAASPMSRAAMIVSHVAAERDDVALSMCTPDLDGTGFIPEVFRMFACALRGERIPAFSPDAHAMIAKDWWHSMWAAEAFARSGDREGAIDLLRNAMSLGFLNITYLAQRSRWLAPLRNDAEFVQLMTEGRARRNAILRELEA